MIHRVKLLTVLISADYRHLHRVVFPFAGNGASLIHVSVTDSRLKKNQYHTRLGNRNEESSDGGLG